VFTVCGLPGSGKTTLAREIERERGAVCFSADRWVLRLYGPQLPVSEFVGHRAAVWDLIWTTAERILALGIDVVLDFSFYLRSERQDFRRRAHAAGADFRLFYLRCPEDECLRRLAARNALNLPDVFQVDEAAFRQLQARFEPPGDDEAPELRIVQAGEPALELTSSDE
jgi:predicted kinase